MVPAGDYSLHSTTDLMKTEINDTMGKYMISSETATKFVWKYMTYGVEDDLFEAEAMFPGRDMYKGRKMEIRNGGGRDD